jgi:hypothetical protein
MYTRDYIMRMIEQLVQVLSRVLLHKELMEYGKGLDEIHLGGTRMLGVDWSLFVRLDDTAMIDTLRRRAEMDRRVYAVAADLLSAESELLTLQGHDDDAWMRMVCAFSLYCEALKGMESEDVRMKAAQALAAIENFELPPSVQEKRQWLRMHDLTDHSSQGKESDR